MLYLFLLLPNVLFAQVQWGHQLSSTAAVNQEQHVVDSEGNIISVGYFKGSLSLGNVTLKGLDESDIFMYKTSPSGQVLWAKALESPSYTGDVGVSTDSYGNIYVAGGFVREIFFEGNSILAGGERWNTFLGKFSKEGDLLWIKGILGEHSSSESRVFGVVSSNSAGEVVIAANISGTVKLEEHSPTSGNESVNNLILAKYSAVGNLDWFLQPAASSNTETKDIHLDDQGNVYFTGFYTSTLTLGAQQLNVTTPGYGDVFVAKLDANGNFLWAKAFNKSESAALNNEGRALAVDPGTQELYLTGPFKGSLNLDEIRIEGENTSEDPGNEDIFLAKLASDGGILWAKRLGTPGHDFTYDLQLAQEQNIIISGAWNFSPFLMALDKGGNIGHAVLFENTGYGWASSVTPLTNNAFYLSGAFGGSLRYSNLDWNSSGNTDGFLIKIADALDCQNSNNLPVKPVLSYKCEEIRIENYNGVDVVKWYQNELEIETESLTKLSVPKNGSYKVSFQNSCGITVSDVLDFNKNDFLPDRPVLSYTCSNINIANYNGSDRIKWFRNEVEIKTELTTEISFPESGTYKVRFENSCGTTYSDDLYFDNSPYLPAIPRLSANCTEISLESYNGIDLVKWYKDGVEIETEATNSLSFPGSGIYKVSYKNSCGTTFSEPLSIDRNEFLPDRPVLEAHCQKILVKNQGDNTIRWYKNGQLLLGEGSAELYLSSQEGAYTVEFNNGCDTSSEAIQLGDSFPAPWFRTVNVITPNGDDKNEYFVVDAALLGSSLEVYNRWGKKVYSNESYQNDWNGQGLTAATYYLKITSVCYPPLKGTLTILR